MTLPSGTTIVTGARQPAFSGTGRAISVRKTYSTAATATARGALRLPGDWAAVPVKSTTARSPSMRTFTARTAPSSRRSSKACSPSGSSASTARMARSALALTWAMYAVTTPRE